MNSINTYFAINKTNPFIFSDLTFDLSNYSEAIWATKIVCKLVHLKRTVILATKCCNVPLYEKSFLFSYFQLLKPFHLQQRQYLLILNIDFVWNLTFPKKHSCQPFFHIPFTFDVSFIFFSCWLINFSVSFVKAQFGLSAPRKWLDMGVLLSLGARGDGRIY